MARPGTIVQLLDTTSTVPSPSDSGTLFAAGLSDRGPLTATLVESLAQFKAIFGDRQSYSVAYDYLETFFREGGYRAYFARVVGPSATSGAHNLLDGSSAISLVVTAVGPGAWSSGYKVQVLAGTGSNFIIQVQDASGNVLEDSGNLADQQSAVGWALLSDYVRITLGASANNPAVAAAAALSAGTDDRGNITDSQWAAALTQFAAELGPGQVVEMGRTTSTAHDQLKSHVEANDRVALYDLPDSATTGTLVSALGAGSRFAAAFAPWVIIPGVVKNTTRTVPPTALIAGLLARNDPGLGANHPAAGVYGISKIAVGLTQNLSANLETLSGDGINIIIDQNSVIKNYGWRSTVNPNSDPAWIDFGNARLFTKIASELNGVAENYLFAEIDGQQGKTIGAFHDALMGTLLTHYTAGELFGDTANDAFAVDTGTQVNTLATVAANELHAIVYVKMSPFGEYVEIDIVKRALTDPLT